MKIAAQYSHLNGLEYLIVHKNELWEDVKFVLSSVNADAHKTKVSEEERKLGRLLYSPAEMNKKIGELFTERGWEPRRVDYYVTDDWKLTQRIMFRPKEEQRRLIEAAGKVPFYSYNQTDFVKDRCMIEVQFGKYAFVAHDLFVKHMAFYTSDHMDVGIEILPTKALQMQMSSGVPYFEGALYDLIREGRGVPHVPLVLVGIEPDEPIDEKALIVEAEEEKEQIEAGVLPDEER